MSEAADQQAREKTTAAVGVGQYRGEPWCSIWCRPANPSCWLRTTLRMQSFGRGNWDRSHERRPWNRQSPLPTPLLPLGMSQVWTRWPSWSTRGTPSSTALSAGLSRGPRGQPRGDLRQRAVGDGRTCGREVIGMKVAIVGGHGNITLRPNPAARVRWKRRHRPHPQASSRCRCP